MPFQRLFVFLASCLLVACASTPSGAADGDGAKLLVVLHDYKNGQDLELASESHTQRVEYYSSARGDASRKVQTDEIMSAFVGQLTKAGFEEHARAGRAPSLPASNVVRWGLEVERDGQREHWLIGASTDMEAMKDFQECRDTFLQLYNITVSYQTIENKDGEKIFDDSKAAAAGKKR